jgi:hypothetical protein
MAKASFLNAALRRSLQQLFLQRQMTHPTARLTARAPRLDLWVSAVLPTVDMLWTVVTKIRQFCPRYPCLLLQELYRLLEELHVRRQHLEQPDDLTKNLQGKLRLTMKKLAVNKITMSKIKRCNGISSQTIVLHYLVSCLQLVRPTCIS